MIELRDLNVDDEIKVSNMSCWLKVTLMAPRVNDNYAVLTGPRGGSYEISENHISWQVYCHYSSDKDMVLLLKSSNAWSYKWEGDKLKARRFIKDHEETVVVK